MQQVPTSANIAVVPCKWKQHAGPNNVACCWPTMLLPFAWNFRKQTKEKLVVNDIVYFRGCAIASTAGISKSSTLQEVDLEDVIGKWVKFIPS